MIQDQEEIAEMESLWAASTQPAPTAATGQKVTVGAPGREMSALTGVEAKKAVELPEGVLAKFGKPTAAIIAGVTMGAIGQAGYNLAQALQNSAGFPLVFAVGFPLMLEGAALTFAWQDIKDRRQAGVVNKEYRAATYATLVISSLINAYVGWVAFGALGLIEAVPPLIIGAMIHMHGNRLVAAYKSRNKMRPEWRARHLEAAKAESVRDVLPLLAGNDADGKASVELLKKRMDSETLTPGDALLAAGYDRRRDLKLTDSQLRRLEIVAATVWGTSPPTPPDRAASPRRVLAATSPPGSAGPRRDLAATPPRLAVTSPSGPAGQPRQPSPDSAEDPAVVIAEVLATNPRAGEGTVSAELDARGIEVPRAIVRDHLRAAKSATPPAEKSPAPSPERDTAERQVAQ